MAKEKNSPRKTGDKPAKEIVRATLRFHGPELQQIREVRDMLSLNTEIDAARFLMQRGLEAMTPVLGTRRLQEKVAAAATAEQIVGAMLSAGYVPDEAALKEGLAGKK